MSLYRFFSLFAAAMMLLSASTLQASDPGSNDDGKWGSLTGQVLLDGDAPENPLENVEGSADKTSCLIDGEVPRDDKLIVGENGELKNAIVMMYIGRGEEEPAAHPMYDETKDVSAEINNVNCRFVPHALFVRTGQTLTLKNSDPIGHNCHITTLNNEHNVNLPPKGSVDIVLENSDRAPGNVTCDVHKWMDGVILVRDNPYVAITDTEGKFKIENVPAGEWKFLVWHKKVGYLRDLEVGDKELGRRGDFEVEIPAGDTLDLGQMKLPASAIRE